MESGKLLRDKVVFKPKIFEPQTPVFPTQNTQKLIHLHETEVEGSGSFDNYQNCAPKRKPACPVKQAVDLTPSTIESGVTEVMPLSPPHDQMEGLENLIELEFPL